MKMHIDALELSEDAVRQLVREQFPDWRELPVRRAPAVGTVNTIFRLGDDLSARFPLLDNGLEATQAELASEANAAAEIAEWSTVPVPTLAALGEPGAGYPLPWSVYRWLPGRTAFEDDSTNSQAFAEDLIALISSLRSAPTLGRSFSSSGRGGDLTNHDDWMAECFGNSTELVDVPRLQRLWADLRVLPPSGPDVMTHGDLIPGNVLVSQGRLAGLLDVGGFGPADPALDLVSGWHLLDSAPREALRLGLGCGEVEWQRGMAWALEQSMGAVWYYQESNPAMSGMAHRTLDRLLDAL